MRSWVTRAESIKVYSFICDFISLVFGFRQV